MISPQDLGVVDRVLDDILMEFPEITEVTYEDKIRNIVNQRVGDVVAILRAKYNTEADLSLMEMQDKYVEREGFKGNESPTTD